MEYMNEKRRGKKEMTARKHRIINSGALLIVVVALVIVYKMGQHDLDECSDRLFEKLTDMKAPIIKEK